MQRTLLFLTALTLASCTISAGMGRAGEKTFSLSIDPLAVKDYFWPAKDTSPKAVAGEKNATTVTP